VLAQDAQDGRLAHAIQTLTGDPRRYEEWIVGSLLLAALAAVAIRQRSRDS
jgi:hypothetical protein